VRRILFALAALAVLGLGQQSAQAFDGFAGVPWGLGYYQPYGIRYRNTTPNPPYFAVNPPVYYGARHVRPYGVSPFATLPQVAVGGDYRSAPAANFATPPQTVAPPSMNPHCCAGHQHAEASAAGIANQLRVPAAGAIRHNPFVETPNVLVSQ
jgi:hypothetical protein